MNKGIINYRKITELLPKGFLKDEVKSLKKVVTAEYVRREATIFSLSFLLICFCVLALYTMVVLLDYSKTKEKWLQARDNFSYWSEIATKQANSPDAYYQAAIYAIELSKKDTAEDLLQKALQLDPSFEKASKLASKLSN
ncbi:MAG TPA: hypothetical protein VG965_03910 [Patescibacteria group bacterium]|nr:hypothetical protein [Patescibacteria group bacterium]